MPYPTILRTTCLVNALVAAGLDIGEIFTSLRFNASRGSGEGVDGRFCEPSVVWYPGGWPSSLNKEMMLSKSATFSFLKDFDLAHLETVLRIHFPASRLGSCRYFFSTCVSSKNKMPIKTPRKMITVHTRFGSRYGYRSQTLPAWKKVG